MACLIGLRMNNFWYDCEGAVLLIKSGIFLEVLCYCNNKSAVKISVFLTALFVDIRP